MKEKILKGKKNGFVMLILFLSLYAGALLLTICSAIAVDRSQEFWGVASPLSIFCLILGIIGLSIGWLPFCGLKILRPQEALVLTLFGKYIGTLKEEGFYYVNPFCSSVNPASKTRLSQSGDVNTPPSAQAAATAASSDGKGNRISLKVMTLNNSRQKINDCLGNPIEIGIAVTWRVVDTAKAVFEVDNYKEYLSLQCDSALRNIVRLYPYDVAPNVDTTGDGIADEGSLRGSSETVAARIKDEIQDKVTDAGLVSNLLVVLCGNHDTQPIVNTGSLY